MNVKSANILCSWWKPVKLSYVLILGLGMQECKLASPPLCTCSLLAEALGLLDGEQEFLTQLLQVLVRRQVQAVKAAGAGEQAQILPPDDY